MAPVVLDKINKLYENGFHAVKDLSIDIADGEFLVLVGPSGCGKSTALRMVAGLEDISTGNLLIGGRRVNDVDPQGRDIAMVFQSYALYPHMSVYDNMAFGLENLGVAKPLIESKALTKKDRSVITESDRRWWAFQPLKRFDPQRPFAVWLRQIALNKCRDHGRRRVLRAIVRYVSGDHDDAPAGAR